MVDDQVNIILFGPPGAGKGTQADNIVKNFNLHKVSTGDLLREEINKRTSLGEKIKSKIDKGFLVSDDLIENLIVQVLSNEKFYNKLVFDGYPRNINQATNLDILLKKYKQKIDIILKLSVSLETVKKRILERQTQEQRADDNEQIAIKRYQTYENSSKPVIEYYKKFNLLKVINGEASISEINSEISGIITAI